MPVTSVFRHRLPYAKVHNHTIDDQDEKDTDLPTFSGGFGDREMQNFVTACRFASQTYNAFSHQWKVPGEMACFVFIPQMVIKEHDMRRFVLPWRTPPERESHRVNEPKQEYSPPRDYAN